MKKLNCLIITLICSVLMFAGCSENSGSQQASQNPQNTLATVGSIPTATIESQGQPTADNKHEASSKRPAVTKSPEAASEWYWGSVGNAKIHAKIDILGDKVTGVYYYDKYKTNIKLSGEVDNNIKDIKTLRLTEDTANKGEIQVLLRSEDYLQGCFITDKAVLPFYLIREGANIASPKLPGKAVKNYDGHWNGKGTSYFSGAGAEIKALFDDLIYYKIYANSGANSGELEGVAMVKGNSAITVFSDMTSQEDKKENVFYEFTYKNNLLHLKSNDYSYYCGFGVNFDSEYTKEKVKIKMPTAQEVGIVKTKEMDDVFKKLVGNKYETFINYTAYADYSDVELDGKKVSAGASILRGMSGYCFYVISDKHIYAAVIDDSSILYYTNDSNYAQKLPKPMADWAKDKSDLRIGYNFKE
ncbi:hypothetical protein [Pseudobacteroides cellulosolvens]|uniref:Lipoprotein n=1 Tax=Pseudobacteroides cellulosolvens ATCC 35603 = DSM 2933 TaxID=398512 RepID=A0A0L6JU84_9FIRM|nr:hypothetical protein [Pseudobacteroides cellulosolvens]KNY29383.1 hypothetical protein Bccel_4657 [Pseudobacteroides cellulosolvens ATCC 35603 = DSM 2933]